MCWIICTLAVGCLWAAAIPVPSDDELAKANRVVEEIYGKQIRSAKTPPQKTKLAQEILRVAREENDPAVKYAALQQAKQLAIEAMDSQSGLEIVQEIVRWFQAEKEMTPEQILQAADALWASAEGTSGRQKLAKQLQAAELYLRLPALEGLVRLKVQKRLESLGKFTELPKPTRIVRLINCHSGLALGVRESQMHPGADVLQWDTPPEVKDSQWEIESTGKHIRFRNHNSGLYLGVRDNSKNPGAKLCQLPRFDPSTVWVLERQGDFWKIKNVYTGLYLGIFAGSKIRGNLAIQDRPSDHPSQLWQLVPLE
ncbi:MAG: RICIN domain-containing protein [Thermoguttaceae bacterium]|nr:RICIN domain-containing protein [Thermoguttaceae bacterium]MDW8039539.1 RICIN domain-containing protein [Thermoguttaceae bacterium]